MPNHTCTMPECTRPYRAKGLCSTHYNQQRQPNRHAKAMVPCAWCGESVLKEHTTKRKPVCSTECRTNIQYPPKCDLPNDHWALWFGASSSWPKHAMKPCAQCNETFAPTSTLSMYCSTRCNTKAAQIRSVHATGGKTHQEWMLIDRACIDCAATFRSPYANEVRCTACVTVVRRRAGTWITKARRQRLYARDAYVCHLCGTVADPTAAPSDPSFPSLDHLLPRSKGGSDDDVNLATAHMECNWIRSDDDLTAVGSLTLA